MSTLHKRSCVVCLLLFLLFAVNVSAEWEVDKRIGGEIADSAYGTSTDSFGLYMAVGAPSEADGNGAIYLYRRVSNEHNWTRFQKIEMPILTKKGSETELHLREFGKDVALTGFVGRGSSETASKITLAVGAPGAVLVESPYAQSLEGNGLDTGVVEIVEAYDAVLVYRYDKVSGRFVLLDDSVFLEENGTGAGEDVDIAMIVESMLVSDLGYAFIPLGTALITGLPAQKSAKIYTECFSGGSWLERSFGLDDEQLPFGDSVAIGRIVSSMNHKRVPNLIAVGAPSSDVDGFSERGAVYLYNTAILEKDSQGGGMRIVPDCSNYLYIPLLQKRLAQRVTDDDDEAALSVNEKSWFGITVATDTNGYRLIVGADKQTTAPESGIISGEATAYYYDIADIFTNRWKMRGEPFIPPYFLNARSGTTGIRSVAIGQDTAIVGMPHLIHAGTSQPSGGAAIYEWSGSRWKPTGHASNYYPSVYPTCFIDVDIPRETITAIGSSVALNDDRHALVGNAMHNEVCTMKKRGTESSSVVLAPIINLLLY